MPAAYCVQYAASNRSTCKTCKTKIDAGALRIGTITAGPGDYDITSWRHLACNKQPKGLVEAELALSTAKAATGTRDITRDVIINVNANSIPVEAPVEAPD